MQRIPLEAAPVLSAPAWIDVDLDAIAHNVRAFRRLLAPDCRLVAVVKANAYGHGMVQVARQALRHGAAELAVANVHEGALLRGAGITQPILVVGPIVPAEAPLVVQHGLLASLGSADLADALARCTRRYLPVHIEIDSGMCRHGVSPHDLPAIVEAVVRRGRLSIAGVYTHFAAAGVDDLETARRQLRTFTAAVDGVRALRGVRRHACNTLGALLLPEARLDAVRIGGGLYGLAPAVDGGGPPAVALRPALALKARIAGLRTVPAGAAIGYGGTFVCQRPSRLGLLPLGYADGLVRARWRGAMVLVRGRRVPIVGVVSMNQTVIDVTDVPQATPGDEVVLIGAQGDECVRAEERVGPGETVYEVTALLRASLPRRFLGGAATGSGAGVVGADRRGGLAPGRGEPHGPRR